MGHNIQKLPINYDFETIEILKQTTNARAALAELKGVASSIPNQSILINSLSLQEAKDSSAIENIVTTHDELYQSDNQNNKYKTVASKEVHNYATALKDGFFKVIESGIFNNAAILEIQKTIEGNSAGFRKLPGTELRNDLTGETVYTPPQTYGEIIDLMSNLEQFINDNTLSGLDPLVKMALIHHQFESVHPFYDGNGRTGRVINILYLVKEDLLNTPVLYLSRYINQNKSEYYKLLQAVRTGKSWTEWVMFILKGVELMSKQTILLITDINELMMAHKHLFREKLPNIYSQDLLNNIFNHPYTKIDFVMNDLSIGRKTAAKYLNKMVEIGLLEKHKIGRDNYYINTELYDLLANVNQESKLKNG